MRLRDKSNNEAGVAETSNMRRSAGHSKHKEPETLKSAPPQASKQAAPPATCSGSAASLPPGMTLDQTVSTRESPPGHANTQSSEGWQRIDHPQQNCPAHGNGNASTKEMDQDDSHTTTDEG